eukprot:TRINITY_DN203_c0_g2_i1.p1 TRINITY_DN203_c0_g2~~TRINITY_DN203_c0_g2_i1.p1  ORF type:complete len:114 (+),score=2.44 TRINITY_DN203_c0_g2_i1:82-423(+)
MRSAAREKEQEGGGLEAAARMNPRDSGDRISNRPIECRERFVLLGCQKRVREGMDLAAECNAGRRADGLVLGDDHHHLGGQHCPGAPGGAGNPEVQTVSVWTGVGRAAVDVVL